MRRSLAVVDLDVDEHERQVVRQPRQERLADHRPGAHRAPAVDRHELEGGVRRPAERTRRVGWVHNVAHRPHRASTNRCSAAAAQKGADCSSGSGSGLAGVTGSRPHPSAR